MLSRPQGHSATGRIMSMKNSNYTIGNRSRDLPVCRAVPQPMCHRVPNHTASTNDVSLLPFIQREPHWKYTCVFLTTVSAGRTILQEPRGFLITASAGKLQVHMWCYYSSFCWESHTAITLVNSVLPWWLRRIYNRNIFSSSKHKDRISECSPLIKFISK
jgi:hypothetical protein